MIVAGIGSRKGVAAADVLAAIDTALAAHSLSREALAALATTTFKQDEAGIVAAANALGLEVMVVDEPGGRHPGNRSEAEVVRDPFRNTSGHGIGPGHASLAALDTRSGMTKASARAPALAAPSPSRLRLDTSPPVPEGEDGPAASSTLIRHPAKRGGGAERSEAEGGDPHAAPRPRHTTKSGATYNVEGAASVALAPEAQILTHSPLSQRHAGTPSVSETAALLAAGPGATLLGPRIATGRVTCALARSGGAS